MTVATGEVVLAVADISEFPNGYVIQGSGTVTVTPTTGPNTLTLSLPYTPANASQSYLYNSFGQDLTLTIPAVSAPAVSPGLQLISNGTQLLLGLEGNLSSINNLNSNGLVAFNNGLFNSTALSGSNSVSVSSTTGANSTTIFSVIPESTVQNIQMQLNGTPLAGEFPTINFLPDPTSTLGISVAPDVTNRWNVQIFPGASLTSISNAINPQPPALPPTEGSLLVSNGNGGLETLAPGPNGSVLTSENGNILWESGAAGTGTVTQVGVNVGSLATSFASVAAATTVDLSATYAPNGIPLLPGSVVYATTSSDVYNVTYAANGFAPVTGGAVNYATTSAWVNANYLLFGVPALTPVSYATTGSPVLSCTYNNGIANDGVGATLTSTTNVQLSIDGHLFVSGDVTAGVRVLIKDQTSGIQNGIYVVTAPGVTGTSQFVLTRTTDFDTPSEINAPASINVTSGSANNGKYYDQTAIINAIGFDALVFVSELPGAGDTLTASSIGLLTVDGIQVINGQRILVKNQTNTAQNGIYVVTNIGASSPFVLTRAADYNMTSEMNGSISIIGGNTLIGTYWRNATSITTIGTTPLTINQLTPGVGDTLTATANGVLTIDGAQPPNGQRILIQNQASGFQNGIYITTNSGSMVAPFILTRTTDFDTPGEINAPFSISIGTLGSVNGGNYYQQTSTITMIGYNNLVFNQLNPGAGDTLTSTTNVQLSIDGVTLAANQRVLVQSQSFLFQNGIYVITVLGSGVVPVAPFVLTRSADFNSAAEMNSGGLIPVSSGTINGGLDFYQSAVVTKVGASNITFVQSYENLLISTPTSTIPSPTGQITSVGSISLNPSLTGLTTVGIGITTPPSAALQVKGGIILNVTPVSGNYTALISDYQIAVSITSAAITITLPIASLASSPATATGLGRTFIITDALGAAATHNITIAAGAGGDTIVGASTFVMNVNYTSVTVSCINTTVGAGRWAII